MNYSAEPIVVDGVSFYPIPATTDHRSFIISTWVRSYAKIQKEVHVSLHGERMHQDKSTYLDFEPKVAEALWMRSTVLVGEDPAIAHAWVCGLPGRLFYAYVPPELRRMGICRSMVSIVCGNKLQHARVWPHGRQPKGWTYNPYLLGEGLFNAG